MESVEEAHACPVDEEGEVANQRAQTLHVVAQEAHGSGFVGGGEGATVDERLRPWQHKELLKAGEAHGNADVLQRHSQVRCPAERAGNYDAA